MQINLIYKYNDKLIDKWGYITGVKFRFQSYIEAFGRRIRQLREEKNLTQLQLANMAEVERNQIYRLEKGLHGATLHTVIAVAVALGKDPRELHDFYHELPLNTDFDFPRPKHGASETTRLVRELVQEGDFFDKFRGAGEVVAHYRNAKHSRNLNSSAVSGTLRELMKDRVLERRPGHKRGTYVYRKVKQ